MVTSPYVLRITRDPVYQISEKGNAFLRLSAAQISYRPDGDPIRQYFEITFFRDLAEQYRESLSADDVIMVDGKTEFSNWTDREGNNRTSVKIIANAVALLAKAQPREKRASHKAKPVELPALFD